jgi:uncharacterized protein (DUF934 family)
MARQLLKGDRIVDDAWIVVDDARELQPSTRPGGPVIWPADLWLAHRASLLDRAAPGAIWLDGDAEPDDIAPYLGELSLVAIRFPSFNDGRALSLAVLLRTRFGFEGELRAIGAVHEDLIHYMRRCGFDSYLLREGAVVEVAQRSFRALDDAYQGSVMDPQPRFRRRGPSVTR